MLLAPSFRVVHRCYRYSIQHITRDIRTARLSGVCIRGCKCGQVAVAQYAHPRSSCLQSWSPGDEAGLLWCCKLRRGLLDRRAVIGGGMEIDRCCCCVCATSSTIIQGQGQETGLQVSARICDHRVSGTAHRNSNAEIV